jgi:manganese/zinc/iron transport system permease protein
LNVLRREGLIRADGVATTEGLAAAAAARRDEARWELFRQLYPIEAEIHSHQGLETIGNVLPPDLVADLDRRLGPALAGAAVR